MHAERKSKLFAFFRKYHLQHLSFIFVILFLYKYQTETAYYIGKNRKSVDFFIAYAVYNGKYVSLFAIYISQYVNQRRITEHLTKIRENFRELWAINRYLRARNDETLDDAHTKPWYAKVIGGDSNIPMTLQQMNVADYKHFANISIILMIYVITNHPRWDFLHFLFIRGDVD